MIRILKTGFAAALVVSSVAVTAGTASAHSYKADYRHDNDRHYCNDNNGVPLLLLGAVLGAATGGIATGIAYGGAYVVGGAAIGGGAGGALGLIHDDIHHC